MNLFDKIKQRKQEKLDNQKIYPAKDLYQVEVGQMTITTKPKDRSTNIVNYTFQGEELLLAEELKGGELVNYLKKTYDTFTGVRLPEYHDGYFTNVRYFRLLSRDHLVLPSPTVNQAYRMQEGSFEGISNDHIIKLITTDFGKKNSNSNLSLNEIRAYEDAVNGRQKEFDDNSKYKAENLFGNEKFEGNNAETFTSTEQTTIESDFEL